MDASRTRNTRTSIYLGEDAEPCPSVLKSAIVVIGWIRREARMEFPVRKICGVTNRAARKASMCGTPRVNLTRLGVLNSDKNGRSCHKSLLSGGPQFCSAVLGALSVNTLKYPSRHATR